MPATRRATRINWTLPAGWSAGEFIWPTPQRLPVGPLMNYGYEDEVLLPMTLTAPANAKAGETVTLTAAASFLVCAEICVPEDATLTLALPVTAAPGRARRQVGRPIAATLAAAPKPAGLAAVFETNRRRGAGRDRRAAEGRRHGRGLFLSLRIHGHRPRPAAGRRSGPDGLTLTLTPGYAFQGDGAPKALAGVLSVGGKAYEIAASPGAAPAGASGLGPPPAKVAGGKRAQPRPGLGGAVRPARRPDPQPDALRLPGAGHEGRLARRPRRRSTPRRAARAWRSAPAPW